MKYPTRLHQRLEQSETAAGFLLSLNCPALAELLVDIHVRGVVVDDAVIGNLVDAPDGAMRCIDFGRALVFRRRTPGFYLHVGRELEKVRRQTLEGDVLRWRRLLAAYEERAPWSPAAWAIINPTMVVSRFFRNIRKRATAR